MKADLRGFHYALEPLRKQRQWQLDALLARLGRLQKGIQEEEARLGRLRQQHAAASRLSLEALQRGLDPRRHAWNLRWLAQLRVDILKGEGGLSELKTRRTLLQAECLAQQQKVEVLDTHRDECAAHFAKEVEAKAAAEADRDWLIRCPPPRRGQRRVRSMPLHGGRS